jgi:hypothetical protein
MIARFAFTLFGAQAEATLTDDLDWQITAEDKESAKTVQDGLNALLDSEDKSPARGFWYLAHANEMATILKAKDVEFEKKQPLPSGTIY